MKRVAAPIVGGLASSFLMELLAYPVVYTIWRERGINSTLVGSHLPEPELVESCRS
jgi:Cu(I)/Ag(I) efflux system membrane protein CusA/SilA